MTDAELKVKLTRQMTSKDYCHQRIFSCIPLLWITYGDYMSSSKTYDFSSVFLNVIKDWNTERNLDVIEKFGQDKFNKAIDEIYHYHQVLCDILDNFNNDDTLKIELYNDLQNISLKNYKDLSVMCRICMKRDNRSKLISRLTNLKKKSTKFFSGIIPLSRFIEEEIIPQKEFLDTFVHRLEFFDHNQFCIFMLCYDIKKSNRTIFAKTKYDNAVHFLF